MHVELERDHRICHAAARLLADVENGQSDRAKSVLIHDVPEKTGVPGETKPVDLVAEVHGQLYSFEHTLVESYPNQIRDASRIDDFTTLVNSYLHEDLPAGFFRITLHSNATDGLTGKKGEEAASKVAAWISETAPDLAGETPAHPRHLLRRMTNPFPITLFYRPGSEVRKLDYARWAPDRLDELWAESLSKAFAEKLSKLHETRASGYSPVLVLEIQDFSLLDVDAVGEAGPSELAAFSDIASDKIVVVVVLSEDAVHSSVVYDSEQWTDPALWQDKPDSIAEPTIVELAGQ